MFYPLVNLALQHAYRLLNTPFFGFIYCTGRHSKKKVLTKEQKQYKHIVYSSRVRVKPTIRKL